LRQSVDIFGEALEASVPALRVICGASHHTSLAARTLFPQLLRRN
jgi:hypothetical protein